MGVLPRFLTDMCVLLSCEGNQSMSVFVRGSDNLYMIFSVPMLTSLRGSLPDRKCQSLHVSAEMRLSGTPHIYDLY